MPPRSAAKRKSSGIEPIDSTAIQALETGDGSANTFKNSLEQYHYNDESDVVNRPSSVAVGLCPDDETAASAKKKRTSSKYAPPSRYAHLPKLIDILESDLICVFVGVNPGIRTATAGHAYAHPSNLFWKLLHSSGCTDRRCRPEEDVDLPRLYAMGNTNIVERPTKDAAELSKAEMAAGTPILEAKIRTFRPEAVCIVGKGIWEAIWRYKHGRNPSKEDFRYGWQDEEHNMGALLPPDTQDDARDDLTWSGAKVFVASSTSGLSASLKPAEKEAIWMPFGEWVQARRAQRQIKPKDPGGG